jgi:hypothetical protein
MKGTAKGCEMSDNTTADLRAAAVLVGDILAESDDERISRRVREEQAARQESKAQRHARGWFLVAELVEMLARQRGWTAEMEADAHRAARMAAGDGGLPVREFPEGFPEPAASTLRWCELSDFNDWLVKRKVKPLTPSASAPAVAVPEPVAAPAEAVPAKWWEAVLPYMVETLKAGRFRRAKEFHRALEVSSGSPGSPFEKVQGELRVRDFGRPVALKTIQNRWKEVRAAAGLR